jgi:predicted ATPase
MRSLKKICKERCVRWPMRSCFYVRGIAPEATYLFKHALVRDAAYESLLKTRRRELHQCLAEMMTEQSRDVAELHPELIAYHYTEAGSIANAIEYWHRSGKMAVQRSANIEAIGHLTRGLELLNALPDSPGRTQQELALRMTMSPALLSVKATARTRLHARIVARLSCVGR